MKKILFSLVFALALGSMNQAKAQCNGANVTVTVNSIKQTATHVEFDFTWTYISGNPSIQIIVWCGPFAHNIKPLYEGRCFASLGDSAAGPHHVKDKVLLSLIPDCPAGQPRFFGIAIRTSSNCNGSFCDVLTNNIPLPVTFASFNAMRNKSNVNISWSTASELNNSGFAVERNINGSWEQIAWVASQALNGNSDALLSYSYTDLNTVKGISQYRIRQVDIDSRSSYSAIRSVRGEGQTGKTIVYPNPSNNGKVNVVFEDAAVTREISVSDMSGRVVRQIKGITNNNLTIENLNPGMYTIRIVALETGEQTVEKIVVNKR